jgi:hypothetical protein
MHRAGGCGLTLIAVFNTPWYRNAWGVVFLNVLGVFLILAAIPRGIQSSRSKSVSRALFLAAGMAGFAAVLRWYFILHAH